MRLLFPCVLGVRTLNLDPWYHLRKGRGTRVETPMLPSRCPLFFLVLSVGLLSPATTIAQDTARVAIQGAVIDARSGLPIEGVEVTLADLGLVTRTDSAGAFFLPDLALGTYHLALQKDGYERAEGPLQVLRPGSMVIRLDPLTASVDPESSRIQGIVRDLESGERLEGALVSIEEVRLNQLSGTYGRFVLTDVPPGTRRLVVSLLGYATRTESITVPPASILTLNVGLTVEPIKLAPISVSVERRSLDLEISGFYKRRDSEHGVFLTQEAIEERNPITTVDLFEGIPGVRVIRQGIQRAVSLTGSRAMSLTGQSCHPAVWINEMLMQQASYTQPAFLDDLVNPYDIAGLEIYQSPARIPIQYNVQGACGVIVIWTRSGGGVE